LERCIVGRKISGGVQTVKNERAERRNGQRRCVTAHGWVEMGWVGADIGSDPRG
jgi:hypothetical protein